MLPGQSVGVMVAWVSRVVGSDGGLGGQVGGVNVAPVFLQLRREL